MRKFTAEQPRPAPCSRVNGQATYPRRALPLQSEIVWCDSKIYTTKRGEGELNRLLSSKTENRHQARSSSRRAPPAPRPASGACAFTVKFSHTQGTSARVFVTNFFDKRYGNMSRAAARGRRAFGIQADRVRLRETPRAKARRLAALDHRLNAQRRRSLRRPAPTCRVISSSLARSPVVRKRCRVSSSPVRAQVTLPAPVGVAVAAVLEVDGLDAIELRRS